MVHLDDDEKELLRLIGELDCEVSLESRTLQQLSIKGLVLITASKRALVTEAGIEWLDNNGWSIR